MEINNSFNTELPLLWHYALKALTGECSVSAARGTWNSTEYNKLVEDVNHALLLLEADNEHDLSLLLPNQENDYLEKMMKYSAVYDIHQYCIDGMLFLVRRIVNAYPDKVENYFNGKSVESVYELIEKIIKASQESFSNGRACIILKDKIKDCDRVFFEKMTCSRPLNADYTNPVSWDKIDDDSEWLIKYEDGYYVLPPIVSMLGIYDRIGRSIGWLDFGPQIEEAVKDLFSSIQGLKVFSGQYLFEKELCECDAVVVSDEYALIIESKRKTVTRKAKGGDRSTAIDDISESYFSSQRQAYRMHRAVISGDKKVDFYQGIDNLSIKDIRDGLYDDSKQTVDFSNVKHFIRVSCTAGNFWILGEGGIADNLEHQLADGEGYKSSNKYIDGFVNERNKLLELINARGSREDKVIKLDRLFISFDKLYDLVIRNKNDGKYGDDLLKSIWQMTRVQSKKGDTNNHMTWFMDLAKGID